MKFCKKKQPEPVPPGPIYLDMKAARDAVEAGAEAAYSRELERQIKRQMELEPGVSVMVDVKGVLCLNFPPLDDICGRPVIWR
jgi:hypothetical protein